MDLKILKVIYHWPLNNNITHTITELQKQMSKKAWRYFAGNLAAWAREKHPRNIRAAVASSAPLQAKLNFKGKNFNHIRPIF